MIELITEMSDGFWGALIGALITGAAGIIVIIIQFHEKKNSLNRESNKQIKYFIYFTERFLEHLAEVIYHKSQVIQNKDKIRGNRIVDVNSQGEPETEEVTMDDDEAIEFLQQRNRDLETFSLPSSIRKCNELFLRLKTVKLEVVSYENFEKVLDLLYKVERIDSRGYVDIKKIKDEKSKIVSRISELKRKL